MTPGASAHTSLPAAVYQALGTFRSALLRYDRLSAARIRAEGLTQQQYALLVMIAVRAGSAPSVGEAAQELMLSHNSAVELSQRAEKAGLLLREADPLQGSRTLLTLSVEGARRLDAITRRLVSELGQERLEMQDSLERWRTLLGSGRFDRAFSGKAASAPRELPFSLEPASWDERPLTWHLLQLHLHSLSPYHRVGLDAEGYYPYPRFERYWSDTQDRAWLIRADRRLAGFLLLNHQPSTASYELPVLHLVQDFQGRGMGRSVVERLMSGRPGRWAVEYHSDNLAAHHFWRSVLREFGLAVAVDREATLPVGVGRRLEVTVPAQA